MAGRALLNAMFPLTHLELGDRFQLEDVLNWGALPEIFSMEENVERQEYLPTYAHVYLKEEIFAEQIVRNLVPFRLFLEVAAQSHGKQINFRKIGRQLKIDGKTIQNYFQILEDTLVGFFLLPSHSIAIETNVLFSFI